MIVDKDITITYRGKLFSYDDACEIAEKARTANGNKITCIKFEGVTDTTTSALARLILLRRNLLESGRDLQIVGLSGHARALYEIDELELVLPQRTPRARVTPGRSCWHNKRQRDVTVAKASGASFIDGH